MFAAPILRGLDDRGRREIEAAGALIALSDGQTLYRAGQTGQTLYAVAAGEVSLTGTPRSAGSERELRRVRAGDSFGEESAIGASWRCQAVARGAATVAQIPVPLFRRVLERAGGSELSQRLERHLLRSAAAELLATAAFTSELRLADRDLLLDAALPRRVAGAEAVYRAGEQASELWIVADGMVQLQVEDGERLRVRAYLLRGDFFGDEELLLGQRRRESAIASGPALLLGIGRGALFTVASRNPGLLPRLRRIACATAEEQRAAAEVASTRTQHAFSDLYRLQIARSLLVIDLDRCARCGHCASACASVHGQTRLVRHGDIVVTALAGRPPAPLLLPTSCQHCENPACMIDCPTGAIGRDPRGEVFIRQELCTGCGACAKACPWNNIDLVPAPAGSPHEAVAVKCDLCRGLSAPACVQACPTEAILRIDPRRDLPEVARLLRLDPSVSAPARERGSWRIWLGASCFAAAVAIAGVALHARGVLAPERGAGRWLGAATCGLWLALLSYSLPKRLPVRRRAAWNAPKPEGTVRRRAAWNAPKPEGTVRWFARRRSPVDRDPAKLAVRSRVRPQLLAHVGLGLGALSALAGHAGARTAGAGGAAAIGLWITAAIGAATIAFYALLPRVLSRLERRALLPEELADHRRETCDRLYAGLSGQSDRVKDRFARVIVPYLRRPLGWLALALSGRTLGAERERLCAEVARRGGGERLAEVDALAAIAVDLRALGAQRILTALLRVGLPAHIIAAAGTTALVAVHVWQVLR